MNEYIGMVKVKNMFKNEPVTFSLRTITVNGQKRGCSGFILHENGNVVYLTTEPFFDGGLFGNAEKSIMFREARDTKDYTGGINRWVSVKGLRGAVISVLEGGKSCLNK